MLPRAVCATHFVGRLSQMPKTEVTHRNIAHTPAREKRRILPGEQEAEIRRESGWVKHDNSFSYARVKSCCRSRVILPRRSPYAMDSHRGESRPTIRWIEGGCNSEIHSHRFPEQATPSLCRGWPLLGSTGPEPKTLPLKRWKNVPGTLVGSNEHNPSMPSCPVAEQAHLPIPQSMPASFCSPACLKLVAEWPSRATILFNGGCTITHLVAERVPGFSNLRWMHTFL